MWLPASYYAQPPATAYRCETCDVFGRGDVCWNCGNEDVVKGVVPGTQSGHHYDPKCKRVSVGNSSWPVERGLKRLILST